MTNMKPIFELAKFADGMLMLRVRFSRNSNFWINEEEATWVPTNEESNFLKDALDFTNEYNKTKRKDNQS